MTLNWKIALLGCFLLFHLSCAQADRDKSAAESKPAELSATAPLSTESSEAIDSPGAPTVPEPKNDPKPKNQAVQQPANLVSNTTKADKPKPKPVTKAENHVTNRSSSTPSAKPESEAVPTPQPPSHSAWDQLLQKHVSQSGQVDYAGFQRDQDQLNAYLKNLSDQLPKSSWERDARLAYWINAYNAYTVKLILDHYPVKSIRDIYDGSPWDAKWIKLEKEIFSLNRIEHQIIRKRFDEPRIHFAVNCAAQSCPPLLNRAFTAEKLEEMLQSATRDFVNDPAYNKISTNTLRLSKIFDWYAEDFKNIRRFINQYSATAISADISIDYLDYDWSLNAQ